MFTVEVDLTAVLGIIGTIAGTVVGAFATYKVQERQLEHSDRTRFQEERLEVYSGFLGATNLILSSWNSGVRDSTAIQEMIRSYERLRLIGCESTVDIATEVHEFTVKNVFGESPEEPDLKIMQEYAGLVGRMINSVRLELKS